MEEINNIIEQEIFNIFKNQQKDRVNKLSIKGQILSES